MALVYLNTLAHGRSGDKGDTSNVCVFARDPKDYEFLKRVLTVERVKEAIAKAPGCRLVDDLANKKYPMPLDTSDQDTVFVGRIRPDLTDECGVALWCCGDQVRKGAATNAIQIAELLIR